MSVIIVIAISIGIIAGGVLAYKLVSEDPRDTMTWRVGGTIIGSIVGAFLGAIATVFVIAPFLLVPVAFMVAYVIWKESKKTKKTK